MAPGQTTPMSSAKTRRSLDEGFNPLGMRKLSVRDTDAPLGGQDTGLTNRPSNVAPNATYYHRTSDYATLTQ